MTLARYLVGPNLFVSCAGATVHLMPDHPSQDAEDPVVLDHLERSLAAVLRLLSDRTTATDLADACGYDLPPASWSLLECLDSEGSLRVSDIAAFHGVDVSSITPRLKKLESAGLLRREREPQDARAFRISIAHDGARALERVHEARRAILREALLGIEPERVASAAEVLCRIAAQLSHDPPSR
jgi:DNA-binding MarR family transcriptional regulator